MRLLLLTIAIALFSGCSNETNPAPVIDVDMSQVNEAAASIIQLKLKSARSSEDWKELGMYYHAHGLEEASIRAYEYSLALQHDSQAQYLLSIAQARLGRYDDAIKTMSTISDYVPAHWRQGFWQLDLGNTSLALEHFNAALLQDPTSGAAIVGLARTYLATGEPSRAIQLLQGLLDQDRKHQYITYLLGKAHQRVGNSDIGSQLLKSSKSGQPKWNDPWQDVMRSHQRGFSAELYLAITKIDANELQAALQQLLEIDKKYPYDPVVQNNLATVYMQLGKQEEAVGVLGKSIRQSPRYAPLRLTMAYVMAELGEFEKAIEFAMQAIELQPSMFAASRFIAKIAYQQQNFQRAYQYYAMSVELGDSNPRTREMLAEVLLRFEQWKKAIWQYNVVLTMAPQRTGSIGGLAVALANDGQIEKANQILSVALKKYPSDPNLTRAASAVRQIGRTP